MLDVYKEALELNKKRKSQPKTESSTIFDVSKANDKKQKKT